MVKVRFAYLALAHVSHFFAEPEPWAYKQSSRFTVFVISENSSSSAVLLPLAPVSLIVQLFDAFLAFSLLFGSFLLYVQEGSAASIQVDMQIEAAARLKSTVSDLPALETYFVWGPPPIFLFPNDLRCGFRKLKERGVGNRTSGAGLVPKSLLVLLL